MRQFEFSASLSKASISKKSQCATSLLKHRFRRLLDLFHPGIDRLPHRLSEQATQPARPSRSAFRPCEIRRIWRRQRGRASGAGACFRAGRLALRLLSGSDPDVCAGAVDARSVLRPTVRPHRRGSGPSQQRALDARPLRHALA